MEFWRCSRRLPMPASIRRSGARSALPTKSWESCRPRLVRPNTLTNERRLPADQALEQDQLGVGVVEHRRAHDHLRCARRHDVTRLLVVRSAHGFARARIADRLERHLAIARADIGAVLLGLDVHTRAADADHRRARDDLLALAARE